MSKAPRKRADGAKRQQNEPRTKKTGVELAAHLGPFQFKAGEPSANLDGRPKSARRLLNDDFIADLQAAWKTDGKAVIERAIKSYPDVFLYANAAIVPPELRSKIHGLMDKDIVFRARMLAACADMKPLRETVSDESVSDGSRPASGGHLTMTTEEKPDAHPLALYRPYTTHLQLHYCDATHDGRLLTARNHRGKARAGAMEAKLRETVAESTPVVDEAAPQATEPPPEGNALALYRPYEKQKLFHAGGVKFDERLFMAGNQLGKTLAGAMEWAMHLTGRYPDWWTGKVFDKPVRLWAAGVTAESTRDNPQRVLIGQPQMKETWGSGAIPKEALKDWRLGYHVADALDSVVVRWGGGGDVGMRESVLSFKSYEKGREKWQGETLDGVWFDEEPPLDIYSEGKTRTIAKQGIVIVTLTPLKGMSDVVKLFLSEADLMGMRAG